MGALTLKPDMKVQVWALPPPALWVWASYFTSLELSFPICTMRSKHVSQLFWRGFNKECLTWPLAHSEYLFFKKIKQVRKCCCKRPLYSSQAQLLLAPYFICTFLSPSASHRFGMSLAPITKSPSLPPLSNYLNRFKNRSLNYWKPILVEFFSSNIWSSLTLSL